MDVNALKELALEMGLKGRELKGFIDEERQREREQREYEAQLEREKCEREVQKREYENRLEREKCEREALLERERREHELKMKELDVQARLNENQNNTHENESERRKGKMKLPSLPSFDEKKDCMMAYLDRLERYGETMNWSKLDYAIGVSALLSGRALDTYSRLPAEDTRDYDKIKIALLKAYDLTPEGFRKRFRDSRPERQENYVQFVPRVKSYLLRWVETSEIERTYEGLIDLLLREQVLCVAPRDLCVFLGENKVSSAEEMASLADKFVDARNNATGYTAFFGKGRNESEHSQNVRDPRVIPQKVDGFKSMGKAGTGKGGVQCHVCSRFGHYARECRSKVTDNNRPKLAACTTAQDSGRGAVRTTSRRSGNREGYADVTDGRHISTNRINPRHSQEEEAVAVLGAVRMGSSFPTSEGSVNDVPVTVLRDTGSSITVVRRELIKDEQMTGESKTCVLIDGTVRSYPTCVVNLESPYASGLLEAVCMKNPLFDVIVGNEVKLRDANGPVEELREVQTEENTEVHDCGGSEFKREREGGAVEEQAGEGDIVGDCVGGGVLERERGAVEEQTGDEEIVAATEEKKEVGPVLQATPEEIVKAQLEDKSLKTPFEWAKTGRLKIGARYEANFYISENHQLCRRIKFKGGRINEQLVIPAKYRSEILSLAHDTMAGGHMGQKRTADRILTCFWWPGLYADVLRYCASCDLCQRCVPRGRVRQVPIGDPPLLDTPFKSVSCDLIGPLCRTSRGKAYVLSVVCNATRYPECVALGDIKAGTIAEALFEIFSRMGFPERIHTDMGANFTSEVMKQVCDLWKMNHTFSPPYVPRCNGGVERFQGTLKQVLRKMSYESPQDWDILLPGVLFALRDSVSETLGHTPFQLVYSFPIRSPISILQQTWTGQTPKVEERTSYQHVLEARRKLQATWKIARELQQKTAERYKRYFNSKAQDRKFKVSEEVLMLLPADDNKFVLRWRGPYPIRKKIGANTYIVEVEGHSRLSHANLLKKYVRRETAAAVFDQVTNACAMLEEDEEKEQGAPLLFPANHRKEGPGDVHIAENLNEQQKQQLRQLLEKYESSLSDVPGKTTLVEHEIRLTTDEPIRCKPYPIPYNLREVAEKEVQEMLDMGIIEPSNSPYSSPFLLVKKAGGESYRPVIDFRKINNITVFDSEPMQNIEEMYTELSDKKYLSKLDLSKGFFQIGVKPSDRPKLAFRLPDSHLYQFTVVPFGALSSPAVFSRMARKLTAGMKNVVHFVDDFLLATKTWEEHLATVEEFLRRLQKAGLTAKPSKCYFGRKTVEFLGHVVGNGEKKPSPEKIEGILKAERPTTKTGVKSFVSCCSYYRQYIHNFAEVARPLNNLVKKGKPNKVEWGPDEEEAFLTLKRQLASDPILKLPDLRREFYLQIDASNHAIGAVLVQEHDGEKFPVAYASRQLLPRESRYSTIERECLAIVWAVEKFSNYLYGKHFHIETDHMPLTYLNQARSNNSRVMRWSLSLSPYRFTVISVKGTKNVVADYLSRIE